MKYRLIALCLMACISLSIMASDCPATMPFRSTTPYWEHKTEAAVPARTGFCAIAVQPTVLEANGIAYSPAEMATTTMSASPTKARRVITNPVDDDDDPANGCPTGDVLFPLLLMALGYAICIRRSQKHSSYKYPIRSLKETILRLFSFCIQEAV